LSRLKEQEPNKRILGLVPLRLWIHQQLTQDSIGPVEAWLNNGRGVGPFKRQVQTWFYGGDGTDLRTWAIGQLGEAPHYYDSLIAESSAERMAAYLVNNGYFVAAVSAEHRIKRKHGSTRFVVDAGPRYYIHQIRYDIGDSLLKSLIEPQPEKPALAPGMPYGLAAFKAERLRVRDTLLNNGFYTFDRNYVEFALDSTVGKRQVDVYVRILPPIEDSTHRRYKVGSVTAYPDYQPGRRSVADLDTLYRRGVELVYRQLRFKPAILLDAIYMRPDDWYVAGDHALTQRKLSELGAFRFVSVQYKEREDSLGQRYLDTYIRLQQSKKQNLAVELNANTNFNALIGSDLDFSYRNRNLFRNADLFTFNLSSGLETQFAEGERFLRSLDFSGSANLNIPKLLLPRALAPPPTKRNQLYKLSTSLSARYTYTRRLAFYTLHSTALTLAYSWQRDSRQAHLVSPVDITLVVPTELTDSFRVVLDNNFLLQQSFQSTIIPAAGYTYVFSDPQWRGGRQGVLFRGNMEVAGNLINWGWNTVQKGENSIGGVSLAQYARISADGRYYQHPSKDQTVAFRFLAAVGVPYGNSDALPFVKQFFAGGPSSIRAWRVRRLGPGGYSVEDTTLTGSAFVDQTGDIQLEANVEYRFPIYRYLEGALFVDAGNIWLLKDDPDRPNGQFQSDFYRDIAIGTGLGLRLDFDFFIVRADMGFRVRDPSQQGRNAWLWRDFPSYLDNFNQVTEFNIAIGYPF
jgi:outer membrane translocation and assembly module TamA